MDNIELRDYFAGKALTSVTSETQETVPANFWQWIKLILQQTCYMTFLSVRYKGISGIYKESAIRCYKYADALIAEKEQSTK